MTTLGLKGLKTIKALSDETTCFTATLLADGKPIATLSNRGCGGPDEWHATKGNEAALKALEAECGGYAGFEDAIGKLVGDAIEARDSARFEARCKKAGLKWLLVAKAEWDARMWGFATEAEVEAKAAKLREAGGWTEVTWRAI